MNRKLTLIPAIIALAFSASACNRFDATPVYPPVVGDVPALVAFDAPQAPGPDYNDEKKYETPQAPPANCEPQYCGEKAP